jgi:hypothetical protein
VVAGRRAVNALSSIAWEARAADFLSRSTPVDRAFAAGRWASERVGGMVAREGIDMMAHLREAGRLGPDARRYCRVRLSIALDSKSKGHAIRVMADRININIQANKEMGWVCIGDNRVYLKNAILSHCPFLPVLDNFRPRGRRRTVLKK